MADIQTYRDQINRRILVLDNPSASGLYELGHRAADGRWLSTTRNDIHFVDLLCLEQPDIILDLHRASVRAGADILRTPTLFSNASTLTIAKSADLCHEINANAARLTIDAAREARRPVLVAGAIGITPLLNMGGDNCMHSQISGDAGGSVSVNDPSSFVSAYEVQIQSLCNAGVDLLMIEECVGVASVELITRVITQCCARQQVQIPVVASFLLSRHDMTMMGDPLPAIARSAERNKWSAVGFQRWGRGGYLDAARCLRRCVNIPIRLSPSVGNRDEYMPIRERETVATVAEFYRTVCEDGSANIVGGGHGSTFADTMATVAAVRGIRPRKVFEDLR